MWLKFTYEGKKHKHKIPLSWEELTLAQLCRVFDVYAVSSNPGYAEILGALMGIESPIIEKMKLSQLDENVLFHLQYLADSEMWERMYKGKPQKEFYLGNESLSVIGYDIPNEITLAQKSEILEGLKSASNWLDKCNLVFKTVYDSNLEGGEVAVEIFPIVTFFLRNLKHTLIIGNLALKVNQVMKNSLQG